MVGALMAEMPRLALATPPEGPEPAIASLALLAALTRRGVKVQHFRAWACPVSTQLVGPITGLPGRHLDPWLMPDEVCRKVFLRGSRNADLSVVEGTIGELVDTPAPLLCRFRAYTDRPGSLLSLIESLELPVVAVVDCRLASPLHLPEIPAQADAVIFDGISGQEQFERLRLMTRLILGKPVLGAVEDLPRIREALAGLPAHRSVPPDSLDVLARSFSRYADFDAIRDLADSRGDLASSCDVEISRCAERGRHFRVAYAMDDAFGGYFPDTLEAIETLGAQLVEFSPLHDEALPKHVDLVMIGCGFPDLYADKLAANYSMLASLSDHVYRGQRIYSEGGGTAYLAHSMILVDRRVPGAGIFPIDAELLPSPVWPEPVERELIHDAWLGPRGTPFRGYRSGRWRLHPALESHDCPARCGHLTAERDVFFHHNAVGGTIHLHLGALPEVIECFLPRRASTVAPPRHVS
jgi:cobyrinic acid a,c-diamide synthase